MAGRRPSLDRPGATTYRPTAALTRLVVSALLPVALAVVLARPLVVLLGVPFALAGASALARVPRRPPSVRLSAPDSVLVEGSRVRLPIDVDTDGPIALAVLRVGSGPGVSLTRANRLPCLAIPGSGAAESVEARLDRWGRRLVGPLSLTAYAADLCLVAPAVSAPPVVLRVLPDSDPFVADEAMPRAAGLVGPHRSRRTGEGGELAGIRAFAPGDRLRRIDWRSTVRTGELHVAETLSDRDADLLIVLDVLHDLSAPDDRKRAGESILDTAVHAAAGIARHYLETGDRVALMEVGSATRVLRPASGQRHVPSVLQWLLEVQPYRGPIEAPALLPGLSLVPSSALVVVLTPLLDERVPALAAQLARTGRSVVAVDTLPPRVAPDGNGRWAGLALRLALLERRNTIAHLLDHGVPTVQWEGAGTLDLVLRDASRLAAAPTVGAGR